MGFRCPHCRKEFGLDRDALMKHLEEDVDCRREAVGKFADRLKGDLK